MTDPTSLRLDAASVHASDDSGRVDDAARNLGLKPVRAWVAAEKKASSPGAERVRRSRERAEESGLKQISVTLPTELHPMLKTLATRTKAGEPVLSVLTELVPDLQSSASTPAAGLQPAARERGQLSAWRLWLLRWLLPSDYREWLN